MGRHKRAVTIPAVAGIGGARVGREGAVSYLDADDGFRPGKVASSPMPIAELRSRGLLTDEQHWAAMSYAAAYRRAYAISPEARLRPRGGGISDLPVFDVRAAAVISHDRLARLVTEELSKAHRAILDRVVIDEVPANRAAVEQKLKARLGIGMLRQALDRLAAERERSAACRS